MATATLKSTTTMPLLIGARVRHDGPGTDPDTGTIEQIVRQEFTDDLFRVAWDHHPDDHDLYIAGYLVQIAESPSAFDALEPRAVAGERIAVRCAGCGYDASGGLTLVDRYTQEMPPGPRGIGDWLEVQDPDRDEGRTQMECPECAADWPSEIVERVVSSC